MKFYILSLVLALMTAANAYSQSFEVPRNAVYVELLGRTGDRLSINYERTIYSVQDKMIFMGRVGTFYTQQKHFSEFDIDRKSGDLIIGISTIYPGPKRHRLETGIGLNMKWNLSEEYGYTTNELITASIGYRLLPKDGKGLMIRLNAELTKNADYNWLEFHIEGDMHYDKIMPWAGLAIGYAF